MNWEVFITCAITGSGDTVGKSPHVPVTPEQIATSAIDAAKAGAAVVTSTFATRDGQGCPRHRAVRRGRRAVRAADVDVVINLTAGMGGDLVSAATSRCCREPGRHRHGGRDRARGSRPPVLPEICTLDCGTMNFSSGGDYIMINTPCMLRAMARKMTELGVRPEMEAFDFGHLVQVKQMVQEGLLEDPVMIQLCMGIA